MIRTAPASWFSAPTRHVAIVGGGFSGCAVAYHLARSAGTPIRLSVFEPREAMGRGVAYSCEGEHLLLNVPAGRLSIDPGLTGDFLRWCQGTGRRCAAGSFLPRAWFGAYAEARLEEAVRASRGPVTIERVREEGARIVGDRVLLDVVGWHGTARRCDHVVLALGHGPTRTPDALRAWEGDERLLRSPWDGAAMRELARSAGRVLLVGTGLTMYDAAITLERLGYRGELVAVSRRGRLPQTHGAKNESLHGDWASGLVAGRLPALIRAVREQARSSGDWRGTVDALRPHTQRLWGGLSLHDRTRFVERVAPYWDTHRHRSAPEVGAAIDTLLASGRLSVVRGRVASVTERSGQLGVGIEGVNARWMCLDGVVLCTGPEPNPARWGRTIVDSLLRDGLARVDDAGMGLDTDPAGYVIAGDGRCDRRLSTLGPTRRGALWESTAAPEIAYQAASLARTILESQSTQDEQEHGHPRKAFEETR